MMAGFVGLGIVSKRIYTTKVKWKHQIMFNKYTYYKEKATIVKWKKIQNLEIAENCK